jgi:hypothetical protein
MTIDVKYRTSATAIGGRGGALSAVPATAQDNHQ